MCCHCEGFTFSFPLHREGAFPVTRKGKAWEEGKPIEEGKATEGERRRERKKGGKGGVHKGKRKGKSIGEEGEIDNIHFLHPQQCQSKSSKTSNQLANILS
jgi:hypothetical protein